MNNPIDFKTEIVIDGGCKILINFKGCKISSIPTIIDDKLKRISNVINDKV